MTVTRLLWWCLHSFMNFIIWSAVSIHLSSIFKKPATEFGFIRASRIEITIHMLKYIVHMNLFAAFMGPQTIWRQTPLFAPIKVQTSISCQNTSSSPSNLPLKKTVTPVHIHPSSCSVWHESPVFYGQESDEISETTKKSPGQSRKPQAISMADFWVTNPTLHK